MKNRPMGPTVCETCCLGPLGTKQVFIIIVHNFYILNVLEITTVHIYPYR